MNEPEDAPTPSIQRRTPPHGGASRLSGMRQFHALVAFTQGVDLLEAVRALTLVLAVIFGFENWVFEVTARICLLIFVLQPRSIRRPEFWLALSVAGTIAIVLDWERTDNHKYLLVYWLWVLFIAHLSAEPGHWRQVIRFNARFFLCLIFLGAAAQKLSSPSYRSGAMFEHYLYVDSRFTAFGKLIGIGPEVPDAVKKRIALLRSPFAEVEGDELEIPGSERARTAALVMTWWDVCLQLFIGALLLFRRAPTDKIAHLLLLLFVFTTYLPAPVFGFGWIIAIIGFALAKDKFPRISVLYLVCFVTILVYQAPWRDWVLAMK